MTPEQQKKLVIEHLERREAVASATKAALGELKRGHEPDPLETVDPEVRRQAEEEFYAAHGRVRYVASNGRVKWLTPQEVEKRQSVKGKKRKTPYYGPYSASPRTFMTWSFNIGAVLLAMAIVWVLMF